MGEKRRFSVPAVGGSSLLTMFGVLCLTVFALLSLATVQADRRLSERSSRAVENYYAADAQAEEILARIRSGEIPAGVTAEGDTYSYICPISDTQELSVAVTVAEDGSCTVHRWQAVSTTQWDGEADLDVWDGNFDMMIIE